jgi:hypothetical protein
LKIADSGISDGHCLLSTDSDPAQLADLRKGGADYVTETVLLSLVEGWQVVDSVASFFADVCQLNPYNH